MPIIKVFNLTYKYLSKDYEVLALDNISSTFYPAINNVIVGVSGCGKTTLIKAILGVIDYEGDILFDDQNVNMKSPKERDCSYVDQDIALYPHLSIFNNIAFPLQLLHLKEEEIRKRVYFIAKEFGIYPCLTRLPHEISIGQAQRASICKALVKKSRVYIFDEALSNLDKPNTVLVMDKINEIITEKELTKIFVTHDIEFAKEYADKIYVMHDGRIVSVGNKQQMEESNDPYIKELFKSK